MADASNNSSFLNPWLLHHQKLGLELKCPLCLNLLNRPQLLPCNHIFCDFCVPRSTQFGSECPVCKQQYAELDVRPAPYMENLVTIYRSWDASFGASLFPPLSSGAKRVSKELPSSLKTDDDNKIKELFGTPQEGSSNGECQILLPTCKRVWAPLYHSAEEGNELTGKFDKSTPPINFVTDQFKMGYVDRVVLRGGGNVWMRGAKQEELVTEELCINQELQSSPISPPSFDTKGIADDPGSSNDSTGKIPAKRLLEDNYNKGEGELDRLSPGAGVDRARKVKRQRKHSNGLLKMGAPYTGCTQPNIVHTGSLEISKLECGELSGVKDPTISDSNDASGSICAFCESSGVKDSTGPMLHYVNGKEVVGNAATNSNVIHAHQICIEWTPQAYFVGETVKNLKAEVARAAKLKCSKCGLRGAGLGCFVKSCRKSYHVPCAMEVLGCRWDFEDFLVLCPNHSSVKFPCEKSKSRKHASEEQDFAPTEMIISKQPKVWEASRNGVKEWVFCASALSVEEKYLLVKFASTCGATVAKFWNPNVTHVIAATDAEGACSRTLKVMKAILSGKWILKTSWIRACMEAMHPVDEEPYEVALDNHGCRNGPKTGRLRALDNAPKLFNGLCFYFSGDFIPGYKENLLDLVTTAGGFVIESKTQLREQSQKPASQLTLIVYNNDPMQGCRLEEDGSVVLQRLETAENLAGETGSEVIPHTWLLESIAACKKAWNQL
ncbi:BRCA1-associated RING domain protein 1-like [Rhododendron vialii]|uniref:BRCA1-associated RING domain protein 1-like n=1 Tax=Rhododendron vialii TaxID=182163 RepID=UPI00265FD6E6|nr:BRCA1-associated RING domain protein 1-like [Rhododendron vialii]